MPCTETFYLKPNVLAEPLVDQWYAWTHLIPPATAARNITERHLKIMDSYISWDVWGMMHQLGAVSAFGEPKGAAAR